MYVCIVYIYKYIKSMYRIRNLQLRRKKHINYNTQKTNTRCKLRAYSISYFHCQISMQSATYPKIPRVGLELPVKIEKKKCPKFALVIPIPKSLRIGIGNRWCNFAPHPSKLVKDRKDPKDLEDLKDLKDLKFSTLGCDSTGLSV